MKATHAFSNEPNQHLWYRVVERFKLRLRDALEKKIKQKGGVTHAIIREAFLNWDADASGKLDPAELVRKLSIFFCRRKAMAPNFFVVVLGLSSFGGTPVAITYILRSICIYWVSQQRCNALFGDPAGQGGRFREIGLRDHCIKGT